MNLDSTRANHLAKNCFQGHRQPTSFPKPQANVVTIGATSDSPSDRYHVTSPEVNCVFNSNDWFIDPRANVHVCPDKNLFSLYHESQIMHMYREHGEWEYGTCVRRRSSKARAIFREFSCFRRSLSYF